MKYKTWNVVVGCSRVSAGCANCYAVPECRRMSGNPGITKKHGVNPYLALIQERDGRLEFSGKLHFFEDRLTTPLLVSTPRIWFVNSLSDLYHPEVPFDTLRRIFAVMNLAHWHVFDILTKRADRLAELAAKLTWTLNIWQGVTFEGIPPSMAEGRRKAILSRIPTLQQHPAKVKFISFEPLVGPIPADLDLTGIDWAFFGGESHQVPSQDLGWVRDGIALCQRYGCKPHVKQLGTNWAVASGNYPPPAGTDRSLYGQYRMGKRPELWPKDLRAYAIHTLREVEPDDLASERGE